MADGRPATRADAPEVLKMKMSNVDKDCEVDGVPVSALFAEDRVNRYGSVAGLDDEELATPEELPRGLPANNTPNPTKSYYRQSKMPADFFLRYLMLPGDSVLRSHNLHEKKR